eukprot:TRINITY_DN23576_c0_g1_i1.p1 TRINITY_DN23576_c0_g1~~TRINITY_DN23576_c0_g1_i1.p1  ORF type:complete len:499 (+),score=74.60 TRINITY_DN23576_c0_g1_i1:66-1562(+)
MSWRDEAPYKQNLEVASIHKAHCYCKRVVYDVVEEPVASKLCHCTLCQRIHGAPYQWALLFHKDSVSFVAGWEHLKFYSPDKDTVYTAETRELPCKVSCSHCGSWIADEGRRMWMAMGSAFVSEGARRSDWPQSFQPDAHIYQNSMVHDPDVLARIPRFSADCPRREVTAAGSELRQRVVGCMRRIVPPLDGDSHKGQQGRVCVIGGSEDFTGAPYYAGMSALRTGAELLYLLTAEAAAAPIKTYSPELMVTPLYRSGLNLTGDDHASMLSIFDRLANWRPEGGRFHSVVLGPGLGRRPDVLRGITGILNRCKQRRVPMVIDADGVWLVCQDASIIRGYKQCILTPNRAEFKMLAQAVLGATGPSTEQDVVSVADALQVTILLKGKEDIVYCGAREASPRHGGGRPAAQLHRCGEQGAPRRSGGIGDLLSGCLGVVLGWQAALDGERLDPSEACLAASCVVRRASQLAYEQHLRGMTAPDVLRCIPRAFDELCPASRL